MSAPDWILVALGGSVGACARFGVGLLVTGRGWPAAVGTGIVNVVGCAAIGFLYARTEDPTLRLGLGVGVLGGFTTFSSFGRETLELVQGGRIELGIVSVALNLGLGLAGAWVGQRVAG